MNSIATIVSIMALAGLIGGYANFLLSSSDQQPLPMSEEGPNTRKLAWWGYLVIGVVASFVVPLFLSLAQSSLLIDVIKDDDQKSGKAFVLIGFCLVAAISSRAFIQTVSSRVIALAEQASRTAAETKSEQQTLKTDVLEIAENIGSEADDSSLTLEFESASALESEATSTLEQESKKEPLTRDELLVLKTLEAKPYLRRTLSGIAADSGIEPVKAKALLGQLIERKLAVEIRSKKTQNLLYKLTARGASALNNA